MRRTKAPHHFSKLKGTKMTGSLQHMQAINETLKSLWNTTNQVKITYCYIMKNPVHTSYQWRISAVPVAVLIFNSTCFADQYSLRFFIKDSHSLTSDSG